MYVYIHIHVHLYSYTYIQNAPQERYSGLDPSILLDWVPESIFSSPSTLLHIETSGLLCETTLIKNKSRTVLMQFLHNQ